MPAVTSEADSASLPAPEVVQPTQSTSRTWLRKIWTGGQITETCPSFCTDNHRNDDIGALDDLQHGVEFDGQELAVELDMEDRAAEWPVLAGRINVDPYNKDAKRRVPHVNLSVFMDEVMECLSPDEFASVIKRVRTHCDRLEKVHAQLLEARAGYH